jgi:WD40 repeat protein
MSNEYQVLSERIYSDFPIFGSCIRQRAAVALSKDKSPQAVKILAEAVVRSGDRKVITIALEALRNLRDRDSVNAFCQVWAESRHKDLTTILKNRRYVSTEPKFLVLSALKVGTLDLVKRGDVKVLDPLLAAISDKDTQIASAASVCLVELQDRKVIDALCKRWIENPSSQLQNVIQKGGYEPEEPSSKALFYFLLGEWQKYENLDFDQSLLAKAYQLAPQELKGRISEKARTGGRIELIKILTDTRLSFNVDTITDQYWEIFTDILKLQPNRREIWRFLNNAPALYSKKLLDKLSNTSPKWSNNIEEFTFKQLFELAKNLKEQDFNFLSSFEAQKTTHTKTLTGHTNALMNLVISLDGQTLISSSADDTVRFWNLLSGNQIKTLASPSYLAAISSDGRVLASGSRDESPLEHPNIQFKELVDTFGALPDSFSYGDARAITINIRLWDLPNATLSKTFKVSTTGPGSNRLDDSQVLHTSLVYSLAISPNGKILISGSEDKTIRLWSLPDGNHIKTLRGHTDAVCCLKMSPNGKILISGSHDKTIRLWSYPDGTFIKTLIGHTDVVNSLAISPDGTILVSGSHDKTIRLWSLPDGTFIKTLTGHADLVNSLVISPDGTILVSGSQDKTIRLWSLPDGTFIKTLTGHTDAVYSLVISPDGKTLASGGQDNTIRLWKLSQNIPIDKFNIEDISKIELKIDDYRIKESFRNILKFTLALIHLRQQFDIDIEDS